MLNQAMHYSILRVSGSNLTFGCIKATCYRSGEHCTIMLYDSPRKIHTYVVPLDGDLLICRHSHSSVYFPIVKVNSSRLMLRNTVIPLDILLNYFNPFEQVKEKIDPVLLEGFLGLS